MLKCKKKITYHWSGKIDYNGTDLKETIFCIKFNGVFVAAEHIKLLDSFFDCFFWCYKTAKFALQFFCAMMQVKNHLLASHNCKILPACLLVYLLITYFIY